jgi:hypothetical protein
MERPFLQGIAEHIAFVHNMGEEEKAIFLPIMHENPILPDPFDRSLQPRPIMTLPAPSLSD